MDQNRFPTPSPPWNLNHLEGKRRRPIMNGSTKRLITLLTLLLAPLAALHAATGPKPNIVYILADDLGYGDVHCLNPDRGKIATPQIDKLAAQGDDIHRRALQLVGLHADSLWHPDRRYNWRTRLQSGVLFGYSEPLIAAERLTVPALLKQHGYATACIGKWHLGLGIAEGEPSPVITDDPTTRGFDSYFGISASLDMPPFAFIENDHFTEPLTTTKKWVRSGAAAASFEAVDVLPTLTRKAVEFVNRQARTGQPFFLYMPLNAPAHAHRSFQRMAGQERPWQLRRFRDGNRLGGG